MRQAAADPPRVMAPRTCQRALVKPSPATSLSPAVSILLLSLNRSIMRSVKAVPAGVLFVLVICHHNSDIDIMMSMLYVSIIPI